MADCNNKCAHCVVWRRFWYCKACQKLGRKVLIARSMSQVLPTDRRMVETPQVFNYTSTRREFVDSDNGFSADSLHSFFCKRCKTSLGYRHAKNHCPTQKATIVKDLKTRKIQSFMKRQYCGTQHQVVYTLCFLDNLVWYTDAECSDICAKYLDGIRDLNLTACIHGFAFTDDVQTRLAAHFSDCGEIQSVSISPGPWRYAFIEFNDHQSFLRAVELDGTLFFGSTLRVEYARHPAAVANDGAIE